MPVFKPVFNPNTTSSLSVSKPDSTLQQKLQDLLETLQLEDAPVGGSVVVYHHGKLVAEANMGMARKYVAWTSHTLSLNFSTGKGVLVTLIHILVSNDLLDYDIPIAQYWSQFAANGKKDITLRQVLTHRSGLFNIQAITSSAKDVLVWQQMLEKVESMSPEMANNQQTESCYSALVSGWVLGGLIEKVTGLELNDALKHYLSTPLGIADELYFGVPSFKVSQVAQLHKNFDNDVVEGNVLQNRVDEPLSSTSSKLGAAPVVSRKRVRLGGSKPRLRADSQHIIRTYQQLPSYACWQGLYHQNHKRLTNADKTAKTLSTTDIVSLYLAMGQVNIRDYQHALIPTGPMEFDYSKADTLEAKIPAANGVSTSDALAKMYAMLANKGVWQEHVMIRPDVFAQLSTIHVFGSDAIMAAANPSSMHWRLGYHRLFSRCHESNDLSEAFGHMGYNGSTAWCDTKRNLAVSFIHNFDIIMSADIRQYAINEAILSWIDKA